MSMNEKWVAVRGLEGLYEVSDQGRVRSLPRVDQAGHEVEGRVLTRTKNRQGVLKVNLRNGAEKKQRAVHHLVLEAFVRPARAGEVAHHKDRDQDNCRVENLMWGEPGRTRSRKCKRGHLLVEPNLTRWHLGVGKRQCRACARARARARYEGDTSEKNIARLADAEFSAVMKPQVIARLR